MKRKIFLILTISILFSGCTPHTINTLTPSANKVIDNRFDGTWVAQDNSGCIQVKSIEDGMIEVKGQSNSKINYIIASAYNSTINNNNYLSIQVHNITGLKSGYLIAQYSLINHKTLKFSYINSVALRHLILSKNLKGEIDELGYKNSIITDTSVNIERAIVKYKNSLFKDYMVFTKGTCSSKR